jgi:hypothetical protein
MTRPATTSAVDDLIPQLPDLWQHQELCDVTLISADKHTFRAHKIILASASRYFQALFVGAGKHLRESTDSASETRIELENVDAVSLGDILACIYQKKVRVTPENVVGLLSASNYLDVEPVRQACCQVSESPSGTTHTARTLFASH